MPFKSNRNPQFRSKFSEDIFNHKYAHENCDTWNDLSRVLVEDVCQEYMRKSEKEEEILEFQEKLKSEKEKLTQTD